MRPTLVIICYTRIYSVQESLGFSPFELVFGHALGGPLLLLKEKWLDEDPEKISVLKYVAIFKDCLGQANG